MTLDRSRASIVASTPAATSRIRAVGHRSPRAAKPPFLRTLTLGAITAVAAIMLPEPRAGARAAEPFNLLNSFQLTFPSAQNSTGSSTSPLKLDLQGSSLGISAIPSLTLGGSTSGSSTSGSSTSGSSTSGGSTTGSSTASGSTSTGSTATSSTAGDPGSSSSTDVPAIPSPGANLVIHYVQPSGFQKVTGRADQDLLLVSPDRSIDGKFQIDVDGFRGVYWIGASFDTLPAGWLTSPNGKRTEGVGTLIRIRTHKDAVRPFIVMGRMHLKTSKLDFGDFAQLGGNTTVGKWQAYPDVWRCRIIAEPLFGWRDYKGGSFSQYVSHSDFTKFETGGVRHSYAARIDATWGYQGEYVLPSYASDKKPYRGPDGRGTAQYWDYVARAVTNAAIGSEPKAKAFFLARSSDEVAAGDYITYHFNTSGRGVWVVPAGSRPVTDHIHPGGGTYAPQVSGSTLTWRKPSGDPFVVGRINDGSKATPPSVVGTGEVGYRQRVTSRSGLEQAIAGLCR
ncbi:MAG: hypothetical protein R3D25_18650 [Geminicoccaceae bacterium]